jgi:hypothetical protein
MWHCRITGVTTSNPTYKSRPEPVCLLNELARNIYSSQLSVYHAFWNQLAVVCYSKASSHACLAVDCLTEILNVNLPQSLGDAFAWIQCPGTHADLMKRPSDL